MSTHSLRTRGRRPFGAQDFSEFRKRSFLYSSEVGVETEGTFVKASSVTGKLGDLTCLLDDI